MSYYNGKDILPEDLITAIQEYVDGEYLYIPRKNGNRKSWGELTDSRNAIIRRNIEIHNKYLSGISVKELAKDYFLSDKTIYSIIASVKKY